MVIENEVKFVLDLFLFDQIEQYSELSSVPERDLTQGYYRGARFRRDACDGGIQHTFTYKVDLPTLELEEFEQIIQPDSYERCMALCTEVLRKIRRTVFDHGVVWDVDFFLTDDNIQYFCMAECEMKSGQRMPEIIPTFVSNHLLHTVDRVDFSKYSSRKMIDVDYARRLLRQYTRPDHHE